MNYWKEAVEVALDEAGAFEALSPAQIDIVAKSIEGSADVKAEATGETCIPNPLKTELDAAEARHKREMDAATEQHDYAVRMLRRAVARRAGCRAEDVVVDTFKKEVVVGGALR